MSTDGAYTGREEVRCSWHDDAIPDSGYTGSLVHLTMPLTTIWQTPLDDTLRSILPKKLF